MTANLRKAALESELCADSRLHRNWLCVSRRAAPTVRGPQILAPFCSRLSHVPPTPPPVLFTLLSFHAPLFFLTRFQTTGLSCAHLGRAPPRLIRVRSLGSPLLPFISSPQPDLQAGARSGHRGPELFPGSIAPRTGLFDPESGLGGTILGPEEAGAGLPTQRQLQGWYPFLLLLLPLPEVPLTPTHIPTLAGSRARKVWPAKEPGKRAGPGLRSSEANSVPWALTAPTPSRKARGNRSGVADWAPRRVLAPRA